MRVQALTLTLHPAFMPSAVVLLATFTDPASGNGQQQWVNLDAQSPEFIWFLDLSVNPGQKASISVVGAITLPSGAQQTLEMVTVKVGEKLVIAVDSQPMSIWFSGQQLDWEMLQFVQIDVEDTGSNWQHRLTLCQEDRNKFITFASTIRSNLTAIASYMYPSGAKIIVPLGEMARSVISLPESPIMTSAEISVFEGAQWLPIEDITALIVDENGQQWSHTWSCPLEGSWKPDFALASVDEGQVSWTSLSYKVTFSDPALSRFQSAPIALNGNDTIVIENFGIIQLSAPSTIFDAATSLPLQSILVSLTGANTGKEITLSKTDPVGIIALDTANAGGAKSPTITFTVKYTFNGSNKYIISGTTSNPIFYLPNSALSKNFTILPVGLTDEKDEILVSYHVVESGAGWQVESQTGSAILDHNSTAIELSLPVIQHDTAALSLNGSVLIDDKDVNFMASTVSNLVPVGAPLITSVTLNPTIIDWSCVALVHLSIKQSAFCKPHNLCNNAAVFCFNASTAFSYWTLLTDEGKTTYDWSADYLTPDGSSLGTKSGRCETRSILIIPKKP